MNKNGTSTRTGLRQIETCGTQSLKQISRLLCPYELEQHLSNHDIKCDSKYIGIDDVILSPILKRIETDDMVVA